MSDEKYKHIRLYSRNIINTEQCCYAINQINKERQKISVYGRQFYRNMRLRELAEIESIVKNKLIGFGIQSSDYIFNWASVIVFIKGSEIVIKLK